MSIVVRQLQQSFHGPYKQLQQRQQSISSFAHNHQQLDGKKSIDSTTENQVKCMTNKVIKTEQLLEQRQAVAGILETEKGEKKSYNKQIKSQSQDQENEKELIRRVWLEDTYPSSSDSRDDYQIYQNGKVNEFFKNNSLKKPKRVSDICLVNDHYIWVKMPDQENNSTNNKTLAEAAARLKEFKAMKEQNDKYLKEAEKKNKQLCRYLRSKRNRITKIAPIREEEAEDLSSDDNKPLKTPSKFYCLNMQSCCQANEDEVEIYQTQTKIFKSRPNFTCNRQSLSPSKITTETKPQTIEVEKPKDIQTISGSLLKSSVHHEVSLEQYGSLIESQNNSNNNDDFKNFNISQPRKYSRFENFNWLLHPFNPKYRKPKSKIQAVVYKTYFVKWTKPPDTQTHGYGVKSLKSSNVEMSVLRRCRSAFF